MPHNWLIAIHHDKKVGAETNVTNQIGIYFGCNHADVESTTTLGLLGARLIQEEKFGLALKDGCKLINVNYYYVVKSRFVRGPESRANCKESSLVLVKTNSNRTQQKRGQPIKSNKRAKATEESEP